MSEATKPLLTARYGIAEIAAPKPKPKTKVTKRRRK